MVEQATGNEIGEVAQVAQLPAPWVAWFCEHRQMPLDPEGYSAWFAQHDALVLAAKALSHWLQMGHGMPLAPDAYTQWLQDPEHQDLVAQGFKKLETLDDEARETSDE